MERSEIILYHCWRGRSELAALEVVRHAFTTLGLTLRSRVMPPRPSAAIRRAQRRSAPVQLLKMHGQELLDWPGNGASLADLSRTPGSADWRGVLPEAVWSFMCNGTRLHGIPVGMHRANCAWFNAAAWARAGVPDLPDNWSSFNAGAARLQEAGIAPLALGGQDWQLGNLFESVVLGLGGPAYYRAALTGHDDAALTAPAMHAVFRQMRLLSGMVDPGYRGRDWMETAQLVAQGRAGMQIMADWAGSVFTEGAPSPCRDVICRAAPGTQGSFVFVTDFFAIAALEDGPARRAVDVVAATLMEIGLQERFSLAKGSIPARLDVPSLRFGPRAQMALADRRQAIAAGSMLGSLTYQQTTPDPLRQAILAAVAAHFDSNMTEAQAVRLLRDSVRAARTA